jgi:glycosyltransferase involved in cell wall biosynthesis
MADEEWPGLLSVVIPVRDGATTIGEQLRALSGQDFRGQWEVVVSDNGSTDETRAVVEMWNHQLPSVLVVDSSDVPGVGHARNVGVDAARGSFIAFCDADDIVSPTWLRELAASSAPGVVVAGSHDLRALNTPMTRAWTGWSDPGGPATDRADATRVERGQHQRLGFLPFAQGSSLGLDRSVWEAVGGCSVGMRGSEDVDFSWRAQLAGFDLRAAPNAVVHYRLRSRIRSMMHQYYLYGRGDVELYVNFKEYGCKAPTRGRVVRSYGALLYRLPQAVRSRAWRGRWCRLLAYRAGRLSGSLHHRVAFL